MAFSITMTIRAPDRGQNSPQFKITVNHPKFFYVVSANYASGDAY